jgi:energy-coupling factor transporter transmembrane protein EcfT
MDFRYSLVLLCLSLVLWWVGKVPRNLLKIPALTTLGMSWLGFFLFLPFQARPGVFHVLPREYAMTVILDLGMIPMIGRAMYTYGSLWIFANGLIKSFTLMSLTIMLVYTTSTSDITQLLLNLGVPNMVSFTYAVALRFFSVMARMASDAVNARRLRGWDSKISRNPVKFVREITPLMMTIGIQFIRATNVVTLSVENRGLGAQRMRPHRDLSLSIGNIIFVVLLILIYGITYYLAIIPPYLGNI